MMKRNIKIFFLLFYTLGFIMAFLEIVSRLFRGSLSLNDVNLSSPSLLLIIGSVVGILALLLAIVSIIILWRHHLPKITYIYPIYLLAFFLVWLVGLSWFVYTFHSYAEATQIMDTLNNFEIVFRFIELLFTGYMLYWLKTNK